MGLKLVAYLTTEVCNAWPVRCQAHGCLPSCRASPPVDRYRLVIGVVTRWESNSRPVDRKSLAPLRCYSQARWEPVWGPGNYGHSRGPLETASPMRDRGAPPTLRCPG